MDNPNVCQGRVVLDLGSGCGASCIAAKLCSAAYVVANDIDPGMMPNHLYSFFCFSVFKCLYSDDIGVFQLLQTEVKLV